MNSSKIWRHILEEEGRGKGVKELDLPFQAKAVHYYWRSICQQEWKLADDPLESARKFIETKGDQYNVALLDVPAVPGTKVIAFQCTDIVDAWATHTQELAMDSTCGKTLISISYSTYTDVTTQGAPTNQTLKSLLL